jgi:hypothetical protein
MSQSKKKPPIQLAGISGGGFTTDGEAISFTLQAHDGRRFTFSVPHEAVGEIVNSLLAMADGAAERRPKPNPESGERVRVDRAFPLQRFEVSHSTEGQVILTLRSRNVLTQSLAIDRGDAQTMGEALLEAVRRILN